MVSKWEMARTDIPLPEITAEEFDRSWTRFKYVALAKEWGEDKQLTIILTLLRRQLLDDYISLSEEEKSDMNTLKTTLAKRAGLVKDPLKEFQSRKQNQLEKVNSYLTDIKKLFSEAFPREPTTSGVLLTKFLTDLR